MDNVQRIAYFRLFRRALFGFGRAFVGRASRRRRAGRRVPSGTSGWVTVL
jgi:hypothetical protein